MSDRDLRHVGELMAIRMLLAECIAELARHQDSASVFIATARARLLAKTRAMDPVSADPNGIVQATCAASISSVMGSARRMAIARLPPAAAPSAPAKRGRRGR